MLNYHLIYSDKRVLPRVYVKAPLVYECVDAQDGCVKKRTVMTENISESGIYFEADEPLPLKTELKVSFKLPKSENIIYALIRVARIETTKNEKVFGMGAVFIGLADKDREEIKQLTQALDISLLLQLVIEKNASDLHLLVHHPPVLRVQGELATQDGPELSPEDIHGLLYSIMTRQQIRKFEQNKELDFGLQYDAQNRFRVNLHIQRGFLEAAFRLIAIRTFSFEELRIPEAVKDLAGLKEGLILITGPTGSGKSTTIAAMVEWINQNRKVVIITLERPIEYVHANARSIIKQREIGVDTNSFSIALQSSLRQDPNVIVVGELDDTETVKTALVAAEAGYLVIASFHAPSTTQAVDRLVGIFPAENRRQILSQLSNCLKGIISQLLIPTLDSKKRILAAEILMTTEAVKKVIRNDELVQLGNIIQTGTHYKMQSMHESIKRFVDQGLVDRSTACFFSQEFGVYNP